MGLHNVIIGCLACILSININIPLVLWLVVVVAAAYIIKNVYVVGLYNFVSIISLFFFFSSLVSHRNIWTSALYSRVRGIDVAFWSRPLSCGLWKGRSVGLQIRRRVHRK